MLCTRFAAFLFAYSSHKTATKLNLARPFARWHLIRQPAAATFPSGGRLRYVHESKNFFTRSGEAHKVLVMICRHCMRNLFLLYLSQSSHQSIRRTAFRPMTPHPSVFGRTMLFFLVVQMLAEIFQGKKRGFCSSASSINALDAVSVFQFPCFLFFRPRLLLSLLRLKHRYSQIPDRCAGILACLQEKLSTQR